MKGRSQLICRLGCSCGLIKSTSIDVSAFASHVLNFVNDIHVNHFFCWRIDEWTIGVKGRNLRAAKCIEIIFHYRFNMWKCFASLVRIVIFIFVGIFCWCWLILWLEIHVFNILLPDHSQLNIHEIIQVNVFLLFHGRHKAIGCLLMIAFEHFEQIISSLLEIV